MKTGYTRDFELVVENREDLGARGGVYKVQYIDAEELANRLPGGSILLETACEGLTAELWDVIEELGPNCGEILRAALFRYLVENDFGTRIISSEED
jgi:hypothetical protein